MSSWAAWAFTEALSAEDFASSAEDFASLASAMACASEPVSDFAPSMELFAVAASVKRLLMEVAALPRLVESCSEASVTAVVS